MRKELAGRTFGRWTVKEDLVYQNNQWKWLCECQCGTIKLVSESNLLSGKSKSCGCLSKELGKARYIDLTGRDFGRLKVIERAGYRHGRVAWLCECQCGSTCVVTAHELMQGKTNSCGCLKRELGRGVRDLTNRRIGKHLLVLYATEKRDSKGSVLWHCRCDCGTENDFSEDSLIHGKRQSCGCLRHDKEECLKRMKKYRHFYHGTCLECLSRSRRSDNRSGYPGVYMTKNNTYHVSIGFCGTRYGLGTFRTLPEAIAVRKNAEEEIHHEFIKCYTGWLSYCEEKGEEADFLFEVEKVKNGYIVHKGEMPWIEQRKQFFGSDLIMNPKQSANPQIFL